MLQPLGIHVLVEAQSKVNNFITKPENAKGEPEEGIILAIGAAVETKELEVGDRVVFRRYSAEPFDIEGKTVHLIEEQDIMGRYDKDTSKSE